MKNILLIEDDQLLRNNTAELLREEGFHVYMAEDGLVGVQLTMRHFPDLILCDINLPNMNGYDFFKTIQQIRSTATIPLIYLSGRSDKEDLRTGMQLGAEDYITKPYDFDELLKVINTRLTKMEKINQNNDEKFLALLDNPSIGVYIYQDGSFLYYNKALAEMFGYTHDEFQGLNFKDIISEVDHKLVMDKIHSCFNDLQNNVLLKFEGIHKCGDKIYFDLYGTVRFYKGKSALIGNIGYYNRENRDYLQYVKNSKVDNLSKREIEVLELICQGKSTSEIASGFNLSQRTVDSHRANLLKKTASRNTAELVMFAIKHHIFKMD